MNRQDLLEVIDNEKSEDEMLIDLGNLIDDLENDVSNILNLLSGITIDNLDDVLDAKNRLETLKAELY